MSRRVVITGSGVVSPLGATPQALDRALREGRSGLAPIGLFATPGFDRPLGGEVRDFQPEASLGSRNLRALDRTSRLLISAARPALEAARERGRAAIASEVGLVVGTMFCSVHTISEFDRRAVAEGPCYASPMDFANSVLNAAAGQAAIWLGLRGTNSTVASGSTSGLHAIAYACDLIRSGRASALLAGGVEELCFESFLGFHRAGLLFDSEGASPRPVPFAPDSAGFALAEGSAFLMLEDADAARSREATPLAEVLGHGSAFDHSCGTDARASVESVSDAIRSALCDARVAAEEIDFVSASANGHRLRDAHEARALEEVFGRVADGTAITAIKAMLGESLGASGALQAVSAVGSLGDGLLPGIPGLEPIGDGFLAAATRPSTRRVEARTCLVNSVGYDGHCSAVVLGIRD